MHCTDIHQFQFGEAGPNDYCDVSGFVNAEKS